MKKILFSVLSSLVLIGAASATSTAHADGYGDAGCGLGAVLLGSDPGFMQVFAATTNGISGNQTFGITTGTLNCGGGGDALIQTAAFVETNREVLAKDIARGSGETIEALSSIAGCSDNKKVASKLQSEYSRIFPEANVTNVEVSGQVVSVLRKDQDLACSKLASPAPRVASK